jgi:hypothetical protein
MKDGFRQCTRELCPDWWKTPQVCTKTMLSIILRSAWAQFEGPYSLCLRCWHGLVQTAPRMMPFNQGFESGSVDRVPRTQADFASLETDHLRLDPDSGHSILFIYFLPFCSSDT